MRDLTRTNARMPAYRMLSELGFEVFTPMKQRRSVVAGRRVSQEVPFIHDLLFVCSSRRLLDPVVERIRTLQYRYVFGGYCEPMVVPTSDMERFIAAVRSSAESVRYYRAEEITASMYGSRVRISGGCFDGYEGHLLSLRGSKYKRLIVEFPNLFTAAVRLDDEMIEVLED